MTAPAGPTFLHRFLALGPARGSLRVRITGSILLLSLLGVLGGAVSVLLAGRAMLQRQISDRLEAVADLKALDVDRWVAQLHDRIIYQAGRPGIRQAVERLASHPGDGEARSYVRTELDRMDPSRSHYREVFVDVVPEARVAVSTKQSREDAYELQPLYVEQAREGPYIQELYPSLEDTRPVITVAAPIRGADGTTVAVLGAHLEVATLTEIFADATGLPPEAQIYPISQAGEIITAERFGLDAYPRGVDSHGIGEAIRGGSGVAAYPNHRGERVLGAYRWLEERQMALVVELPEEVAYGPARRLAGVTLAAGLVLVVILGLVGRALSAQVVAPLEGVANAAHRVASGDFAVRLEETGDDEVAVLARSFNRMTRKLDGAYGELQDQVSATREALRQVEEGQALLQSMADAFTGLAATVDREGRLTLVNRRFCELFCKEGRVLGLPLLEVIPAELVATLEQAKERARFTRREVETHFTLRGEDGLRHFTAVVFPLSPDDDGWELGLIALDRTAGVEAEEEQARLEEQLRHAQKLESLGLLAGGIAHDFNNLLQAIMGHVDLLEDEVATERGREHVAQVVTAAKRAAELTGQLLTYAGRRTLRVEHVDVNQVIRDLENLVRVTFPKTAELALELDPEAGKVEADPAQVSQVVLNLLTNAGDALPEGRGRVVAATRALALGPKRTPGQPSREFLPDGHYLLLTVRDDGCGMSSETLAQIFDPFFTTKETGRGLGLAAVQGIIQRGGGHLSVESEEGLGTTFQVHFPRVESVSAAAPPPPREGVGELDGATVLVVDDEETVRRFVVRTLQRAGATVLEAGDGLDGLERFSAHADQVDALVLDLTMPGMGGAEVMSRVRVDHPRLPIVISSGYDATDSLGEAASDPGVRVLQKPYRPVELVAVLATLLQAEDYRPAALQTR